MDQPPSSPRSPASNNGVQVRINYHRRKRASTALVTSRILKAGLGLAFSYAAISQAFFLKKWANQNPRSNAINDDDTPHDFYWQEGDAVDEIRASKPKEVKLFEGITVPMIGSSSTTAPKANKVEKNREDDGHARSPDDADARHAARRRKDEPSPSTETRNPNLGPTNDASLLQLIPKVDVQFLDKFSDSWLISKKTFMAMNIPNINYVEQACFQIMARQDARMTVDWTDFMVEHLSKWWSELKILVDSDSSMFDHAIYIFHGYIERKTNELSNSTASTRIQNEGQKGNGDEDSGTEDDADSSKSPLHPTIGIIAYQTYESVFKQRQAFLSPFTLATTLLSLIQVGFGRIVVVGYKEDDWKHSKKAFELIGSRIRGAKITSNGDGNNHNGTLSLQVGHTELAYVKIPSESWVKTEVYKINMPKGALLGIQAAIRGNLTQSIHNTSVEEWLGSTYDRSYWKYFYLTEPDTILHTKKHLLPLIRDGLDKGIMYMPHRLQPLPHEFNLPPAKEGSNTTRGKKHLSKRYRGQYLPGDVHPFSNITFLDPWSNVNDHCCDAGKLWPGRSLEEFGDDKQIPCGNWWWACGYNQTEDVRDFDAEKIREKHKRLLSYPMMSLESGTGIVFGPSEQGRRCLPSKKPCSIPTEEVADERK